MAGSGPADLIVIFGAVHTPLDLEAAALDTHLQWVVPNGQYEVAEPVRRNLAEQSELFVIDDRFHDREHAVEVELPLVREVWSAAAILPVEVPLDTRAPEIGRRVAQQLAAAKLRAVYLASSDLTHYGPAYRFAPAGVGKAGFDWARDNDRRLLDRVVRLEPDAVLREVAEHHNACGGGAIAAMLAACREHGASEARVLSHANSCETLAKVTAQREDNAVGYASVVVG